MYEGVTMKRQVSFFLLITILAGLLAACGAGGGPTTTGPTAAAPATAPTAAPAAAAPTAAPAAGGGTGEVIKIVSSLPRTGSSKGQTDTVVNAIKQRLEEDKYQACNGQFTIQ